MRIILFSMRPNSCSKILLSVARIALWSVPMVGLTLMAFAQGRVGAKDSLVKVVERGDLVKLRTRLSSGANANEADNSVVKGWTPLIAAAYSGNVEAARLLLDAGAAIEARTQFNKTALDVALSVGNTQVAELLRCRGAKSDRMLESASSACPAASGGPSHSQSENLGAQAARPSQEELSWQAAKASGDVREFRKYLGSYPSGTYAIEAKGDIVAGSDRQWAAIKDLRSEREIANFIKSFPESTHINDAETLRNSLYDDVDWVTKEGTLVAYRRYLQRNPNAALRTTVEKKLIDLEVAEIAAGDHGTLPAAQRVSSNSYGSFSNVCIENGTSYELTVRYSGSDSKKLVVPAGERGSLQLLVGPYTVAASVSAANVRNYVGSDTLQGGEYSSRFYIRSSLGSPSTPIDSVVNNACQR